MTTSDLDGWRNGQGQSGPHMLDVKPYRDMLRALWRRYTLGQLAAISGCSPSTLRKVMWTSEHIQVRTATKLLNLEPLLRGGA